MNEPSADPPAGSHRQRAVDSPADAGERAPRDDAESGITPGTLLAGHYRVERLIGRGGMATVFRAEDLKHGRPVAVKVMRPELALSIGAERFLREIQFSARLQHPHIVPLFDSGVTDAGLLYFVMPFEGEETLRVRLARERQLPLNDALQIASEIADALAFAHRNGIVHRDIKPANVLLSAGHARVADFGIARALSHARPAGGDATDDPTTLTTHGLAIGTPAYMSPEQGLGDHELDGRSDVYSLGCVLYEMLAGQPPFPGGSAQVILGLHRTEPPRPVRDVRPDLPEAVDRLVARALGKAAADRFDSADEMRQAILRLLSVVGRADSFGLQLEPAPLVIRDGPSDVPTGDDDSSRLTTVLARRILLALLAVTVFGAAIGFGVRWFGGPKLDIHRVAIFPLHSRVAALGSDAGESLARLMGYALEGTAPMRWLDARDYLTDAERARASDIGADRKRDLARSLGAAYLIDGSVEPRGDSMTVILRLHRTDGDSVLTQRGASGLASRTAGPGLALGALAAILPDILERGRRVDAGALAARDPAAIVAFLQGERAYRESRFELALAHYTDAIARDSALTVATLKAAQAASWLSQHDQARQLSALAMRRSDLLPVRYATYARALSEYLGGAADSAADRVTALVEADPHWADAWFLLGEIYFHLIPQRVRADSLEPMADSAFRTARWADAEFSPASQHLIELRLLHGQSAAADTLAHALRPILADSARRWMDAMMNCVRNGTGAVDWGALRGSGVSGGWIWGGSLLSDPARGACARAALRVTLTSPGATAADRWGALVGINASLIAAGRDSDVVHLVASPDAAELPGGALLITDAVAGAVVAPQDSVTVAMLGRHYASMPSARLWLLVGWYAARHDTASLRQLHAALLAKRDSSESRVDSLFVNVAAAHLASARGSSAEAVARLARLMPHASHDVLQWQPWEALAGERMAVARLLAASGRHRDAIAAASSIDATSPVVNLVFLRQSLALRARSARALGDESAASAYEARMARWRADVQRYP